MARILKLDEHTARRNDILAGLAIAIVSGLLVAVLTLF